MKFIDLVSKRQSDREYLDKDVDKELVNQCLEAARLAPSASNSQPWTFVVIDEPELKNKVAAKTIGPLKSFNKFTPQSAVVVAIVLEKPKVITEAGGRIKNKEYPLIDIGIAAENFCLQAAELGLGTCMIGWFDERAIKKLIHVPKDKSIPLLITLGYTPESYKTRKKIRKDFKRVVRYNSY